VSERPEGGDSVREATDPSISIFTTRAECAATTGRILDKIEDVGTRVNSSTGKIEKIVAGMATVERKQAEDRAYRRGLENGGDKATKTAVSIREWIVGGVAVGAALAGGLFALIKLVG